VFNGPTAVISATATNALGTGLVYIDGGTSTSRLELSNNSTLPNAISVSGRQGAAINVAAIVNTAGNNTLSGTVSFVTGGADYTIQSDAGTLNLTAATSLQSLTAAGTRNLHLAGAGNGVVGGAIVPGPANPTINLLKEGAGTWTLNGANTYTGNTTVNGGTLNANTGIKNGAVTTVSNGATLNAAGIKQKVLTVNPGTAYAAMSTVTAKPSAPAGLPRPTGDVSGAIVLDNTVAAAAPLTLGTLDSYSTPGTPPTNDFARIDTQNNDIILYYDTSANGANLLKNIDQYVKNAFDELNNGSANGTAKIGSSIWASDPQSYALAVADNNNLGINSYDVNYPGSGLNNYNEVIVKFTFAGDMNLDGLTDANDYGVVDNGILLGITSGAVYTDGDSDYNGSVNSSDYAAIDNGILNGFDTGTPLSGLGGGITAIPEPSTWVLGTLAALSFGGLNLRRRRSK
jgi:autotransporter-associated beta strand protein